MAKKKLPREVDSLDDIDEKYHDLYEEDDEGGYVLLAEGGEGGTKSKLSEFRANNRKLFKENKELKDRLGKLEDIDPEKYQQALEALEKVEEIEKKKLVDEGKIDELIANRTAAMKRDHEAQIRAKDKSIEELKTRFDRVKSKSDRSILRDAIISEASRIGQLQEGAEEDILGRAERVFTVTDDGDVAPHEDREDLYDSDGNPLAPKTFAKTLPDYLFVPGSGGGAEGGKRQTTQTQRGTRRIDPNDPVEFGRNLEGILEGKVDASLGE